MAPTPRIQLHLDLETPPNPQIVDQLRTLFVEGAIAPAQAVPSVRRLAGDLGVHFNTVADAYRILKDDGWLEIAHGRGVRVLDRRGPSDSRGATRHVRPPLPGL